MRTFDKLFAVAAMIGLMIAGGSAAAAEPLRIGTEGAYPPFNLVDENGELQGFDVDIAKALCAAMETECTFVKQDWDGIIPALLAGKYDAIVASMSITEERQKAVDFTERYYTNKLRFIAGRDLELDISAAGLRGLNVGAQRATIAGEFLEEHYPDANVRLYDTQENTYLDLATGRLDAVLADALVNYEWLNSDAGTAYEFKGAPVFEGDRIAIALRKGNPDLVARFNAAIQKIRADGIYQRINAKYFPFDIY